MVGSLDFIPQWYGKLLTSYEHESNMIQFTFLKCHCGCHVEKVEGKQKERQKATAVVQGRDGDGLDKSEANEMEIG